MEEPSNAHRADFIDFRDFVKDCAQEPEFVEYFNRSCGAKLQAPITSLLDDSWMRHGSEQEQMMIGYFIVFVHQTIWCGLKTAAHRTGVRMEFGA
jgi:hypothetical protein